MWEFLIVLLFFAFLIQRYLALRGLAQKAHPAPTANLPPLDRDAWALLRGGARGLLRFVLMELFLRKKISFHQAPRLPFALPENLPDEAMRQAIMQKAIGKVLSRKDFKSLLRAYPIQQAIAEKARVLIKAGLLRPEKQQQKLTASSKLFFVLSALLIGLVWFFFPALSWFFLLPTLLVIIMLMQLKPFHRYATSPTGKKVLKYQQEMVYEDYVTLRKTGALPQTSVEADPTQDRSVLFFLALFGFAALSYYQEEIIWSFAVEFSEGGSDGDSCSGSDGSGGDGGGGGGG